MKIWNKRVILAGLAGLGLVCVASMQVRAGEKDKEEDEVKVTLDQVPAAVKATLQKEAGDAKIKDVDKTGKIVYEIDVMIGKNNYEIKVADDGTLISKKLDDEEDEKDAKDEESAKDEKGAKDAKETKAAKVSADEKGAKEKKKAKEDKEDDDEK
jgi:hypothetical protein